MVLASKSPRRRELMKRITPDFIVFDSDVDEEKYKKLSPIDACKSISLKKAQVAKFAYPDEIIISADTIVVLDNKIINKPIDEIDAYNILKKLSNKEHQVITAYTIIKGDKTLTDIVISNVIINDLDDDLINSYIKSGSPLDKAGAYGIQDNKEYPIVKSYTGSYDNIVGFPVDEIKHSLETI